MRARFEAAAEITSAQAVAAAIGVASAGRTIRRLVGDRVVVLPSASSVAPLLAEDVSAVRDATMRLTCLAGLGGLPAVTVPRATEEGLPCGVGLVAGPGRDRDLLGFVRDREERLRR